MIGDTFTKFGALGSPGQSGGFAGGPLMQGGIGLSGLMRRKRV